MHHVSTAERRRRRADRVIEAHLDAFLNAAADHAEGARLPMFVEQEFRDFLTCGVLAHELRPLAVR